MQKVNITSHYGWDQSEKLVKLYIPIPNANEIKKEGYTVDVQARSIQLGIDDHHGVNYNFKVSNLCGELVPAAFEIKFRPNKVILHLQKKEIGKQWNDIKVKKIADVYSQMQRQMEAGKGRTEPMAKDMEERIINGYGPPSIQGAIKSVFGNASPTAEKTVSEQQQANPRSTNPFDISDTVSLATSPLPHPN